MKRILNWAILAIIVLSSCVRVPDYDTSYSESPDLTPEQINDNVKKVFGTTFDPNQDWTMSAQGSVKITADANLNDIVKVQILTESPFLNGDAMVLNQKDVSNGETAELTFEAPKGATKLIAACVNKSGDYYVKAFDINAKEVCFRTATTRASTRGETNYPEISAIKIEASNSMQSYNARRTIEAAKEGADAKISIWKNSGWEKECLWKPSRTSTSNGWTIDGYIVREIPAITNEEKTCLEAALGGLDGFTDQKYKYNNMQVIRELNAYKKFNNYLTSNGEPLVIAPVGILSSDQFYKENYVYYYYYKPEAVAGKSESEKTEYIKSLPKFRAMTCSYTRDAAVSKGYATIVNSRAQGFFKVHEYLLPYYGDGVLPTDGGVIAAEPHSKYKGIYRIHNNKKGPNGDYYLTYLGEPLNKDKEKLDYLYSENNVDNQLWQIFKMPDSDDIILYNIGAKSWLVSQNDKGEYSMFSTDTVKIRKYGLLQIEEKGDNIIRFKSSLKWGYLGANPDSKKNNRVAFNKLENGSDGYIDWQFVEYNGDRPDGAKDNIVLDTKSFEMNPVSLAIPAGYKIGFMHRKGGEDNSNDYTIKNKGETYGDGYLNKEINSFPDFNSAVDLYGMRPTDPRVAIFKANNHNYITFEDGTDCNFTDIVIEIVSGIQVEDGDLSQKPKNAVYTYCFEDRQNGDYDMNDIVIKAMRLDATHVLFSIEACGAYDELNLREIHGKLLSSYIDVHQLFGISNPQTYINTQPGATHYEPIQEVVQVDPDFSFSNVGIEKNKGKQVYIYNKTEEREVRLSTRGEDPHGLMIPCDFKYPTERTSLHHAYPHFLDWTKGDNTYYDWYNQPNSSGVYDSGGFQILESTKAKYPQYFKDLE